MKPIEIEGTDATKHHCQSYQKGDWIIFFCTECDYIRKRNWKTGEMRTSGGDITVLHSGFHIPDDKKHLMYVPN